MHEKQMHKHNCVVTLTYDAEHLPGDLSLRYRDYQRFMKKLRKALGRRGGDLRANLLTAPGHNADTGESPVPPPVRFYMGGEYGEIYGRPHYHAALFGIDFADKIYLRKTPVGSKIYTSETLSRLWKQGYASIGELTFESAAYIARYIMKKRTGDGNTQNYEILDLETGEIRLRKKEFNNMSRKPGIASAWFDKYHTDAYPRGKVILRGHQVNAPRYYDNKFKELDAQAYKHLKAKRQVERLHYAHDNTRARLTVREQVQAAATKSLQRKGDYQ